MADLVSQPRAFDTPMKRTTIFSRDQQQTLTGAVLEWASPMLKSTEKQNRVTVFAAGRNRLRERMTDGDQNGRGRNRLMRRAIAARLVLSADQARQLLDSIDVA